MTENKNTDGAADAINDVEINDVEKKKVLEEMAKNGNLEFKDVTFAPNDRRRNVGECFALVGFKDQKDAKLWAELTGGEFGLFFRKYEWQLLTYKGRAVIMDIYHLARRRPVVFLEGNENLNQLCEKFFGISLINHIRCRLDLDKDKVPESLIKAAVDYYETGVACYPLGSTEEDDDYYSGVEYEIREQLRYLDNFKGYKGYVVVDDIILNWIVEGEYDNEYPANYKEDNIQYIFGPMYPIKREEEIRKIIEE